MGNEKLSEKAEQMKTHFYITSFSANHSVVWKPKTILKYAIFIFLFEKLGNSEMNLCLSFFL